MLLKCFRIILDLQNGQASNVAAGYFKTYWIVASTEAKALSIATNKIIDDAQQFDFIDKATVRANDVKVCTLWAYLINRGQPGRTFYKSDLNDPSQR